MVARYKDNHIQIILKIITCWNRKEKRIKLMKLHIWALYHTGAMYSSVPTKEFDGVAGSETKLGGRNSLDLLRLEVECFITCKSITITKVKALYFKWTSSCKTKMESSTTLQFNVPLAPIKSLSVLHFNYRANGKDKLIT